MSERDIRKLLALVEAHIGREWSDIAEWLRNQNDIDAIEQRLLAYDFQGVVAEVEAAARRFAAETHSQLVRSGQTASKWLDDQLPDRLVRFDATNQRSIRAAQRNELELVYGMADEQRAIVRSVIVDGQQAGLNPRTIARDIRDSIGLNPTQEKAVRSYRRALESGDWGNALGRGLSSGQTDRSVRSLQGTERKMTDQQIETAVERYRQNQLTYRAEMIARTESAKNVHMGMHEAFSQAVERGDVEADQLVREWIVGPRTRYSRDQHQAMDGQQAKFGDPFTAPDGTRLMYPGSGPPDHAINCRCSVATTLDV